MKTKETEEAAEKGGAYSAPALEKGLDILEALCQCENGLTQQEVAVRLGRNLGEIYRMLTCLVRRGYVANYGNLYTITSKLFQLSHYHPPTYRLLTAAIPIMEELSQEIAFPCDLRVYNSGVQIVIASIQPPNGLGFMTRVGSEIAVAPSASGLVLVAFQDPVIQELRIRESLPNQAEAEVNTFRNTLKEVAAAVKKAQSGTSNAAVVISADRSVKYEVVVKVMDNLQRAGVQRVGLSVQLAN